MKRVTMCVREHSGLQRWRKSKRSVKRWTGLRRANQELIEGFCRQQSSRRVIGRSLILCWSQTSRLVSLAR